MAVYPAAALALAEEFLKTPEVQSTLANYKDDLFFIGFQKGSQVFKSNPISYDRVWFPIQRLIDCFLLCMVS